MSTSSTSLRKFPTSPYPILNESPEFFLSLKKQDYKEVKSKSRSTKKSTTTSTTTNSTTLDILNEKNDFIPQKKIKHDTDTLNNLSLSKSIVSYPTIQAAFDDKLNTINNLKREIRSMEGKN